MLNSSLFIIFGIIHVCDHETSPTVHNAIPFAHVFSWIQPDVVTCTAVLVFECNFGLMHGILGAYRKRSPIDADVQH